MPELIMIHAHVDLRTERFSQFIKSIPFIAALLQGWDLAKIGYQNKGPSYRRKQQWKAVYHVFFNYKFSLTWFDTLVAAEYSFIFKLRPRLYIKPFRTYISTRWNKEKKLKVIFDSYRFMKSKQAVFSQLVNENKSAVLAHFPLDEENIASLVLGYDDQFRKEGEVVLSLECEQLGGRLVSVAFSFEEVEANKWVCWVGCVQGHSLKNMGKATKSVQKLMHGLRPNSFIMTALQDLCRSLDCAAIYCVADSHHSYRKKHAIHLPWRHTIGFDYDGFWLEVGAQKEANDWFNLPLLRARKEMSELKTKKRAMYRKRYAMLDEMAVNISAAVNG
jgi:uncharacterized protein VirK/YbjX